MLYCLEMRRDTKCSLLKKDVVVSDEAMLLLTKIGMTSLRYAIHSITASALVSYKRKVQEWSCNRGSISNRFPLAQAKIVEKEDVARVYQLFIDVVRSTEYLAESQQTDYLMEDQPADGDAMDD